MKGIEKNDQDMVYHMEALGSPEYSESLVLHRGMLTL